jgi:hypothetical protein
MLKSKNMYWIFSDLLKTNLLFCLTHVSELAMRTGIPFDLGHNW